MRALKGRKLQIDDFFPPQKVLLAGRSRGKALIFKELFPASQRNSRNKKNVLKAIFFLTTLPSGDIFRAQPRQIDILN
jgi:hypothetical protein